MTQDVFARAVGAVVAEEGGLADHPEDPGGITKHGISIRFAGSIGFDIDGDGDTDAADIRAITPEIAAQIYAEHFWTRCHCPSMPAGVALMVFDSAVNQGPATAIRLLQRALGLADDGVYGPVTDGTVRRMDAAVALDRLVAERAHAYARTPRFDVFGRGWLRRVARIHRAAIALEEGRTP